MAVRKTTFDEEQIAKDRQFLQLKPIDRLRIHERLRRKIWGSQYNKTVLKGMKVVKKPATS